MIQHAMQDWLCVSTEDNPVLLVEPPTVKHSRREKWLFVLLFILDSQKCCLRRCASPA